MKVSNRQILKQKHTRVQKSCKNCFEWCTAKHWIKCFNDNNTTFSCQKHWCVQDNKVT